MRSRQQARPGRLCCKQRSNKGESFPKMSKWKNALLYADELFSDSMEKPARA